jgi:hypothetical protein
MKLARVAVVIAILAAAAAQKPDFSGTWTLSRT